MKIVFTNHALGKFDHPDIKKFNLKEKDIRNALGNPDYHGEELLRGAEFILKSLDPKHNLRVIYTLKSSIITVITFYPSRKARYEK
ncbi:DUF4258 domain-containing protein [Candidatus Daviesbacteria bacterium]|nr:DUF4258 domain-containing protein [Candidatus Daviesbacteria bacterium]